MSLLLRLALLAHPQPLRTRYGAEIAEFPVTPLTLLDVLLAGLRERLDNLVRDIRHAARSLLRTPGATFARTPPSTLRALPSSPKGSGEPASAPVRTSPARR